MSETREPLPSALDRAEIASAGFCVHTNHGVRWPYAAAVWKIDGRLYCDDCARNLRPGSLRTGNETS